MKNYKRTYKFLFNNGLKYETKSQTISLSLYGSTIGATRYPQFIIHNQYRILPRPYPPSKPGNKGWKVLQLNWFVEFVRSIEQITIQYFETMYPDKKRSKTILSLLKKSKKVIPLSCRIADTFFTQMGIIGNLKENGDYVSKHMDKEDLVTALFHVGHPSNGGETKYYTGLTSDSFGHVTKEISCEHGQITIGCFDKILHCGESWSGIRGCINFNVKKKILEHFLKYGDKYYNQFESNKFPSGPFFMLATITIKQ